MPLPELPPQAAIHSVENARRAISVSIRVAFRERLREPRVTTIPISPGSSTAKKMPRVRSRGRCKLAVGAVVVIVSVTDVALELLLGLKLHVDSLGRPAQL